MDFRLDRSSLLPLHDQLCSQLRLMVERGELEPGDRLPTARELAGGLGVNQNTVAGAYRTLEAEGLLETRRRGGTRVAAAPADPGPERRLLQRVAAGFAETLEDLGIDLDEALAAVAAQALLRRSTIRPRVAVLARSPLEARLASKRAAAILGPDFVTYPATPESYRSTEAHLTVIDPVLTRHLSAAADVIPGRPSGPWAFGPDYPAGAD